MIHHLINDLALYEGIIGGSTLEKIERLGPSTPEKKKHGIEGKGVINRKGESNLKIAYSIIQFLRLKTYLNNDNQHPKMLNRPLQNATLISQEDFENLEQFFIRFLPFYWDLLRYFLIECGTNRRDASLKDSVFYDPSYANKRFIHSFLTHIFLAHSTGQCYK